jgi:transposase
VSTKSGEGRGYSKDYWPDLRQMILALIVDGAGRPICTKMWLGNMADGTALSIGRVCVIADCGMISVATIERLEARKWSCLGNADPAHILS